MILSLSPNIIKTSIPFAFNRTIASLMILVSLTGFFVIVALSTSYVFIISNFSSIT
jgi:hypothetical protein